MRAVGGLSRLSTFILAILVIVASTIAGTGYTVWRLRTAAIDRNFEAASMYARAFEDHLTQSFNVIDLTLVNALGPGANGSRTDARLAEALRQAPYLRSLAVLDMAGKIAASSNPGNVGVHIVRGDFLPPIPEPRAILRAGPPWVGRDFRDGRAVTLKDPADPQALGLIPLLRDVALDDGHWLTMLASLNTDYLLNHYGRNIAADVGAVELLRYDGILLLSTDEKQQPGTRPLSDAMVDQLTQDESGRFEQKLDDGRTVLTAFRASRTYPFVIVVRLDKENGLRVWRDEAASTVAFVSAMLLATLVLAKLYFVRLERLARQHDADEEQLRLRGAALDAAANAIIITDRQGEIEWANPAFCALSGYGIEEIVGRNPRELVKSAEQASDFYTNLWGTICAGKVWRGELINRRKDGTSYLEGQTITPVRDENGAIRHFIAVKQDISESKEAENALRDSQTKLHATLDAIPDLLFEVNLDGRYISYHSPRTDLLAAPPEMFLGKLVSEVLPPDAAVVVMAALRETNERGRSTGKQIALALPQGELWFELSVAKKSTAVDGEPCFIVLSRDITERRRDARRMEELSRHLVMVQESARRRLAGDLHDRTSPNLAAISVNLDIMTATLPEGELPVLCSRLEDVRALVEDTTASIREICSDLRPPVLDYAGVCAALESYAKQFQRRTSMAVQIDCVGSEQRLAPALESALFRIVQEALTNCAKHSRAKSILVSLRMECLPVVLSITDDGIGFDPDLLGKTTHTGGLGILTMREMAELSGGTFALESRPGKGTRIQVEIYPEEAPA